MAHSSIGQASPSRSSGGLSIIVAVALLAGLGSVLAACSDVPKDDCPSDAECVVIHTESGAHLFTVEWAIEAEERRCGLMFREEMAADHGMVFDFQEEQPVSFWMRNTLISLDMVFIRDNGEVLNVAENMTPLSLESVPADGPVRYVLEVVAGTAERLGLAAGDTVDLARAEETTEGTAICFPGD